jgi:membrane protein implicated in regulation of membrane protease activity
MMDSFYIFVAIVGPLLLLALTFGPKLLLVKAVWAGVGILLFLSGLTLFSGGGVASVAGIFFAALGVLVVIVAVQTYFQAHLKKGQERRFNS